jgi:diguanylate cyclase (GGDEF)-like protein/putative nucleotidyltransferase with HDIG domain
MTAQDAVRFRDLPPLARVYVAATIGIAAVVSVSAITRIDADHPLWLIGFLLLAWVTAALKVSLPLSKSGSSMSFSYAISFTVLLVLGVREAVLVAVTSGFIQCTVKPKFVNPTYRTLFSMATLAVAVQGAGFIYERAQGDAVGLSAGSAISVVAATLAYYLLNTSLVAVAIGLSTRQSAWRLWLDSFLWSGPSYFVGSMVASAAAILIQLGLYLWVGVVAIPLYLTYRSYRIYMARIAGEQAQVREASDVQLKIIEALVVAIEAKDSTSEAHLQTLQICAEALARAAGMSEEDTRCVRTAALLHDIGNLAVPDHILSKPAALTYEEYEKIKIHARVGAGILEAVPFPRPVAPLILAHHERWDGRGYPSGVAEEEIPLGARVLAVADNFTALVSKRPHRHARSVEEALEIVKQRSGKVLDPTLVATFVRILPTLDLSLNIRDVKDGASLAASLAPAPRPTDRVLEEIAIAHREALALQEISDGFGSSLGVDETMSMIGTRLDRLIPLSCCVLYLRDEESGRFQCRRVVGAEADQLHTTPARTLADLQSLDDPVTLGGVPVGSALACPLIRDAHVFGAIVVYHPDSQAYTDDHRRLLQRVAQQAASVVHNAVVFDQTQEASLTDALTGLPNRRSLQSHLAMELARASRDQCSVAVMLMDLDGFKQINDRFGHEAGDAALRSVASELRGAVRPYDLCARLGGDEFVVVLWQCDVQNARRKCEEMQTVISSTRHETESGDVISLGISAGIAVFDRDGTTAEQLLALADSRMYENKAARRQSARQPAGVLLT